MTALVNPWKCLAVQQEAPSTARRWQRGWGRWTRLAALSLTIGLAGTGQAAEWNTSAWEDESTLELRTTEAGTEHWSPVWLVVIDGDMYIRLGTRAANRMTNNQTAPQVGIRIAGHQFDEVLAEAVPDKAEVVAAAMADKYWSDVLVRYFSHPLTMRLVAETSK